MRRLEASVFGVLEHYAASLCLWRFQFGGLRDGPNRDRFVRSCNCSKQPLEGIRKRTGSKPLVGSHQGAGHSGAPRPQGEQVNLKALSALEQGMRPHALLYAKAYALFRDRVRVVERAAGVPLICESP